ncbi:MAG: ATP-binding protein [bacterium]
MSARILLSWSSGKDSAWSLHRLRESGAGEVVGLLTTFNAAADRVAMHAVRHALVEAQAAAARLPLWAVDLPAPCSNAEYEARMHVVIERARGEAVTHIAFGDLFLEDIRAYRVRQLAGSGIEPLFPLWGTADDTPSLARAMMHGGVRAVLTCVDPRRMPERFAGRQWDDALLGELPPTVDPCGERGEFHTFCHAGPMFDHAIDVQVGDAVTRDGFRFADLLPSSATSPFDNPQGE